MKTNAILLLAGMVLCAPAALAQAPTRLTLDLDRDGRAETFQLTSNGESEITLTILRPGKATIAARNFAWSLEAPSLERAPNGSLRVKTSHMGIGRYGDEQTLTIAYRNGAYQVLGITRNNWDKLDPASATSCDINLVTGRGKVNNRNVQRRPMAKPVTAWNMDQQLPAGCFIP